MGRLYERQVVHLGNANLENIKKGVALVKKAIKSGLKDKPELIIYQNLGVLKVGVYGLNKPSLQVNVNESSILIQFTEKEYHRMAQHSENILYLAKVIQKNAYDKKERATSIPYQEFDDLLYNIGEFLEDENSLNVVYNQGVGSFNAYDFVHVEDMVEAVRGELMSNKRIKGIQIKGIERVTVYIQVKNYNDTAVSFTYLGNKDNVYETFDWNGKDNLKQLIQEMLDESTMYDNSLTSSRLDKDTGGYQPKTVSEKSVLNLSDDEFGEILEDY